MKDCLVCGFREKNDSSSFCSNCGKSFENEKAIVPKQNILKSAYHNNNKWSILRIFVIIALILNTFIIFATDFSIPFLYISQIFILVLVFIVAAKLETIRSRSSRY